MQKITELRELSVDELQNKILDLRKKQFQQRMSKSAGALEKTHVIKEVRRSIARIKTIMTEKAE